MKRRAFFGTAFTRILGAITAAFLPLKALFAEERRGENTLKVLGKDGVVRRVPYQKEYRRGGRVLPPWSPEAIKSNQGLADLAAENPEFRERMELIWERYREEITKGEKA